MSDLLDLTARVVSWAAGDEGVEAFAVHSTDFEVTVYEAEVESLSSSETRGVGVRVVTGGRMGFASTSDVTEDGLRYALHEARSNAMLASVDAGNVLPAPAPWQPLDGIFVPGLDTVPVAAKVAAALELERLAVAADPRIAGVESATYGDTRLAMAVSSTTGVSAEYERTDTFAYVGALARAGDDAQPGMGFTQGRSFDALDLAAAASEAAVRAARLLGARKPETTRVPVVFDPLVTAQFLGSVASALTAEAVQKGRSLFASLVGAPVVGAGLSLVDDGRLLDGPAAAPVDDEGVPTGRTVLVADGVLERFLYDTTTAAREGVASTGNGSRSSYKSSPSVAPTNLFLDGPTASPVDILARADGGLYVQDVSGIHSGVNPVSGEFSVGATGLWIAGGGFGEPVREVTVSSTIVEMLKAVTALGSDRRFFPFGGALAGATLLLAEMTVAGS